MPATTKVEGEVTDLAAHARYTYTDEDGEPLFQVRRRPQGDGKTFAQFRWERGGWEPGLGDVEPVLYRLHEVIAAAERGRRVYITEGEKDADALRELGVMATTNPGGAGKWRDEYSEALQGASSVAILRDRDAVGARHALSVERSLRAAGITVRHRRARKGKDVSDHIAAGLGLRELVRKRPKAPEAAAEPKQADPPASADTALPAALQLVLDRTGAKRVAANQWEARCPAHADRNPSLSIARGSERPVVLHCHAGCELDAIAAALKLDPRELSVEPADPYERDVAREQRRIEVREEARRRIASEQIGRYELPAEGWTFAQDLAEPRPENKFTVAELHLAGGNTLLTSAFKAGKTTTLLNLARSLADDEPFLGKYEVALEGRIAVLNYELAPHTFREWALDIGIKNTDRLAPSLHLRGATLPFWLPDVMEEVIAWLRREEVGFLIVDPAARAQRGLVESENDNVGLAAFTDALDALKREAGVPDLLLSTHMGRERFEEGQERSRGATRLEDWMDVGWYLTAEGGRDGPRALRAMGRDVDLEAIDLNYRSADRRLTATGQTRHQRREDEGAQQVVDALALAGDGVSTEHLKQAIKGSNSRRSAFVQVALEQGLMERRYADGAVHDEAKPSRAGEALLCHLTERGHKKHARRVERPS